MKEPLRIVDDVGNHRARALLGAEPGELPPMGAEERLLAKLGAGIALGPSPKASGVFSTGFASKWFWLATLGGALALGGMLARARSKERGATAPIAVSSFSIETPRANEPPAEPTSEPAPSPVPVAEQAAVPAPSRRRSSEPSETLAAEIRLLDRARAALADGRAGRALEMIDEYDRDFSHGHLQPEAFVIRLDALARSGEVASAQRLARDYLASHPTSPHSARVRRIVEVTGPSP